MSSKPENMVVVTTTKFSSGDHETRVFYDVDFDALSQFLDGDLNSPWHFHKIQNDLTAKVQAQEKEIHELKTRLEVKRKLSERRLETIGALQARLRVIRAECSGALPNMLDETT